MPEKTGPNTAKILLLPAGESAPAVDLGTLEPSAHPPSPVSGKTIRGGEVRVEATISETVDISVSADMAETIEKIAVARHVSRNRALADLLHDGITAYERRRTAFLEFPEYFQRSTDPAETERLREERLQMIFGN